MLSELAHIHGRRIPAEEVAFRVEVATGGENTPRTAWEIANWLRTYTYTDAKICGKQLKVWYILRDNFPIGAYSRTYTLRTSLIDFFHNLLLERKGVTVACQQANSFLPFTLAECRKATRGAKTYRSLHAIINWKPPFKFVDKFESWCADPNSVYSLCVTRMAMHREGVSPFSAIRCEQIPRRLTNLTNSVMYLHDYCLLDDKVNNRLKNMLIKLPT